MPQSQGNTEESNDRKRSKRPYIQCELWKRQALIEKVDKEGMIIKDAAKYLEINYLNAKHIMKVYRQTWQAKTKVLMKKKNRDSKQWIDVDQEADMEVEQQYSTDMDSQAQAPYCESNYGQCQLPIDENMMNINFLPEPMSDKDKQRLHSFLFEGWPSCQ